jgi:hypothetical protein
MSLTTYDGLIASIRSWLMDRDDLAGVIPDFIALAEADINNRLRLRSMLTEVAFPDAGGDLPADCVKVRSVARDGYGHLAFASDASVEQYSVGLRGGQSLYWTIEGNRLVIGPEQTGGGTVTLRYYQRIPALSASNQTNDVLTRAPGAYLYGALMQAAPFLLEDQRLQTWGTLYSQAIDLLQASDDDAEYPGPLEPQVSMW